MTNTTLSILKPEISASTIIKVPFHDVDGMHIVWHGHYLKYFELARCELLDLLDYNYMQMEASGFMWPVIDSQLKYIKPAKFEMDIKVTAILVEYEFRLKIKYLIENAKTGERLNKGHTCHVAVNIKSGEMQLNSPPVLRQKIEAYQERLNATES